MSYSKNILNEAACECMSPDQHDNFEKTFNDEDLCRRFLNCVEKRLLNRFLVDQGFIENKDEK